MSLFTWPIVVIDTETDGLTGDSLASVIEIGAVCVARDGTELAAISTLVRPLHFSRDSPSVAESMAISGITYDELEHAPDAVNVNYLLYRWWTLLPKPAEWTSWRLDFDAEMVRRSLPVFMRGEGAGDLRRQRCLWEVSREQLGHGIDITNRWAPRLIQAAGILGVDVPQGRHRALVDARLAAAVAVELERELAQFEATP